MYVELIESSINDSVIATRSGELFQLRRIKLNFTVEQVVSQIKRMNDNDKFFDINISMITMYECGVLDDNTFKKIRILIEKWLHIVDGADFNDRIDVGPRRTVFSKDALIQLNELFSKTKYPSFDALTQLSIQLNVSTKVINRWFMNKRCLNKKTSN